MSLTYGILLLAVCTVFVSMPHGTLSSKCSKSSVAPICGVGCNWGAWTGWVSEGTCNVTCGNGSQVQYRNRTCIPQTVGKQCNATSSECQSIPCNTQSCTVDGGWNVWNSWTSDGNCFTTCSVCAQPQTRYRECTRPVPQNGGNYCSGSSTESKNISCDVITCPLVNGGWGEWRNWTESSSCSTSCGGGTMTIVRTRFCINPPPENGGKHCNGTMSQSLNVPCNTEPCSPVNASWGDWTPWTSNGRWNFTCTTGSQTQTRSRPCSIPQSCGFNCDGDATFSQILQCNKETCPPECPLTGNVKDCSISSISMTRAVQTPTSGCTSLNCMCDEIFHGHTRYPSNCTQFIKCAFNKPFISSCESGTYWNQKLQICDQGKC